MVLVLGVGRCAFRPPRVVFVLGLGSLINSLTSGKKKKKKKKSTSACRCPAGRPRSTGEVRRRWVQAAVSVSCVSLARRLYACAITLQPCVPLTSLPPTQRARSLSALLGGKDVSRIAAAV